MALQIDTIQELLSLTPPLSPEQVDNLQSVLGILNSAAAEDNPEVADAVYDRLKQLLEDSDPSSEVLATLWDDVESPAPVDNPSDPSYDPSLDIHLSLHPMESIFTIKSWDKQEFRDFASAAESIAADSGAIAFHLSQKIDGHGIRLVYKEGIFVKATSRARSTRGRDITRQMSHVVPQSIPVLGIVEIRGEVCLPVDDLSLAREFNPALKTAFSAVSSLLKPASSPEENSLLHFLAYRIFTDWRTSYSRTQEYEVLQSVGFEVPQFTSLYIAFDNSSLIEDIQSEFDEFIEEAPRDYLLDGVVLEIDEFVDQEQMAFKTTNSIYRGAALALKVGDFAQGTYSGIVSHINWTPGRIKFSPVAVLDPPVITESGNSVANIPLYEPINIYKLEAYPGFPLSFKYGGEAGVIPCYPDGTLLTDSIISDTLQDF